MSSFVWPINTVPNDLPKHLVEQPLVSLLEGIHWLYASTNRRQTRTLTRTILDYLRICPQSADIVWRHNEAPFGTAETMVAIVRDFPCEIPANERSECAAGLTETARRQQGVPNPFPYVPSSRGISLGASEQHITNAPAPLDVDCSESFAGDMCGHQEIHNLQEEQGRDYIGLPPFGATPFLTEPVPETEPVPQELSIEAPIQAPVEFPSACTDWLTRLKEVAVNDMYLASVRRCVRGNLRLSRKTAYTEYQVLNTHFKMYKLRQQWARLERLQQQRTPDYPEVTTPWGYSEPTNYDGETNGFQMNPDEYAPEDRYWLKTCEVPAAQEVCEVPAAQVVCEVPAAQEVCGAPVDSDDEDTSYCPPSVATDVSSSESEESEEESEESEEESEESDESEDVLDDKCFSEDGASEYDWVNPECSDEPVYQGCFWQDLAFQEIVNTLQQYGEQSHYVYETVSKTWCVLNPTTFCPPIADMIIELGYIIVPLAVETSVLAVIREYERRNGTSPTLHLIAISPRDWECRGAMYYRSDYSWINEFLRSYLAAHFD